MESKKSAEKDSKNQDCRQARQEQEQQTPAQQANYLLSVSFASAGLPPEPNNRHLRQASILQMQRNYGNRYVMRMLATQADRRNGEPTWEEGPKTNTAAMLSPFQTNNQPETSPPYPPQEIEVEGGLTPKSNGHIQRGCTDCDDEDVAEVQPVAKDKDDPSLQRDVVDDALEAGKAIVSKLKNMAKAAVSKVKSQAESAWSQLKDFGSSVLNQVKDGARSASTTLKGGWSALKGSASALWEGVKGEAQGLKDSLAGALESVMPAIQGGWEQLKEWAGGLMEGMKGDAQAVANNLHSTAGQTDEADDAVCIAPEEEASSPSSAAEDAAAASLTSLDESVRDAWAQLTERWGGLVDLFSSIRIGLKEAITSVSTVIKNLAKAAAASVKAMWKGLENQLKALYKGLKETARSLANKLKSMVKSGANALKGLAKSVAAGLRAFLGNLASALMSRATSVINKLKEKARAIRAKLKKKGQAFWRKIKGKVKVLVTKLRTKVKDLNRKAKAFIRGLKKKGQAIWGEIKRFGRGLLRRGAAAWARIKAGWGLLSGKAKALWAKIERYFRRLGSMSRAEAKARLAASAVVQFKPRQGADGKGGNPRQLIRRLGRGRPLDGGIRSGMEGAFGVDFSGVRVHIGPRAAEAADSVDARAFTVGRDVAFGAGEYQPGSPIGDALIAHELAHVIQQRGAQSLEASPAPRDRAGHDAFEEDADLSAVSAVVALWTGNKGAIKHIGQEAIPRLRSGLSLRRCTKGKEIDPTPKQMGEKNVEGMEEANKPGGPNHGIWYWHNYKAKADAGESGYSWDDDYRTGHTVAPFAKTGVFTWVLNDGTSAAAGIRAWMAGLTIADCAAAGTAIQYNTILSAVGDKKFDRLFGSADPNVTSKHRLKISQYPGELPLKEYLWEPKGTIVGDWYYWANHPLYKFKHPGNTFQGENAMYLGDGKWSGLGVPSVTGEGMLKILLDAYNQPRSAHDLVKLEEKKKEHGGTLPDKYVLKSQGGKLPDNLGDDPQVIVNAGGGLQADSNWRLRSKKIEEVDEE